eukprot:TRINITY_DN18857_c0_g1_i1.p1 TRINITY_DN18857_c0_g1~~TRINITY_DN18857_c0_g1_i1.p1  ORF type:complete len:426 (-),score=96.97 TRINITY_DN18857_c0_g1_i1:522-1739(-)
MTLRAMGSLQEQAQALALSLSAVGDDGVRIAAAKKLGRFGEDVAALAVAPLVACLADGSAALRMQAARALGKMGPTAAPVAVKPLQRCFEDWDATVRAAAVAALGWLFDGAPAVAGVSKIGLIGSFLLRLSDEDSKVREAAAGALGRMGEAAAAAPQVATALARRIGEDDDLAVRVTAAGAIARHLKSAVQAILGRLQPSLATSGVDESAALEMARQDALACLRQLGDVVGPHGGKEAFTYCIAGVDASIKPDVMKALGLDAVDICIAPASSERTVLPVREPSSPRRKDRVLHYSPDVQVHQIQITPSQTPERSPACRLGVDDDEELSAVSRKRRRPLTLPVDIGAATRQQLLDATEYPRLLGTPTPRTPTEKLGFFPEIEKSPSTRRRSSAGTRSTPGYSLLSF